MKEKVLLYCWGAQCEMALKRAVEQNGYSCIVFSRRIEDYHADSEFALRFLKIIHSEGITAVFGYDYFPLISMLCEVNGIPYLSWIYDCPLLTLQSISIRNSCNYIFCFDRLYTERLSKLGAQHCFHSPLGGDTGFKEKIDKLIKNDSLLPEKYCCDISFVGNLYNEEKNRLRKAVLPEYIRGYLEGIIEAQLQIYGYNFIKETLTEEITERVTDACKLKLGKMYIQDDEQLAADAIGMEVSSREREKVLSMLGNFHDIRLYTGSKIPESFQGKRIKCMGYADYEKEMPLIFRFSKINLNITSKTIESGIPLRVFDILSCGGFCMTNYQPEIAEFFEDGQEIVMYTSLDDLLMKTEYYLQHEEERKQIACNGYAKVCKKYELSYMIRNMFEKYKLYFKETM